MEFTGERFIPNAIEDKEIEIEHLQRYLSVKTLVTDKVVLDIACGEGYGSKILSETAKKVYGIDIDNETICHAKEYYTNENLEFINGSVERIPLEDNSVDIIISYETIEHLNKETQDIFLQEIKRVLKKEGLLVISTPEKSVYSDVMDYKNDFHLKEFYKDEFKEFLAKYFEYIKFYYQKFEIVSILSEENAKTFTSFGNNLNDSKYIIAICSQYGEKIDVDINSINLNTDKSYLKISNRILQLQDEVEKLSIWGENLDKTVNSLQDELNKTFFKRNFKLNKKNLVFTDWVDNFLFNGGEIIKNPRKTIFRHPRRTVYNLLGLEANKIKISKTDIKLFKIDEIPEKFSFKKENNPLVSIIIPVYNQYEYTICCLWSILQNNNDISYEIILADDVSTDERVKNIVNTVENIKVIRNNTNLGFLKNCNNAAKQAKGKYIVFLNNDTQVQQDWLKNLVELMETNTSAGMVGSKLIYPDGRLQEAGGIIWNDASGWNYGRYKDPELPEYNYIKECDYISGASIMVNADLWNKIGGFDERYAPAYYEDTDLAFEIRNLGYKVVYQPKSVVVHFEGVSNGTDEKTGIKSYQAENKIKFFDKWKDILAKEHFENGKNVFVARDKSVNKKTILVIDHYVPHYDKDAGSRSTFQYLKLFADMGYNVKFIGDNFFKHEPYTTALEQMGIEVLYGAFYYKNWQKWIIENADYIDFVYLNRPHISLKYIDFLKQHTHAKLLYQGHDLHYLRELRKFEVEKDKRALMTSEKVKIQEFDIFKKVDSVCYFSQVEIDEIKKDLPQVNALAIPLNIYNLEEMKANYISESREDLLFVGGFNHTPNIDAVLWFTKQVFPLIMQKIPNIKFYIIGSNPPEEILNLASDNIIVTGYVTDEELNDYYNSCKLVIAPLRYGAGVKGKIIEAIFNKVPVVTTSIGAEGINNSSNILIIADDEVDMAAKIVENYNNNANLNDISAKSYAFVKDYFSEEAAKNTLSKLL